MQHWYAFLLTCLVLELTPGPNMGYLALVSMREGKGAGFAAVAGIASGLLLIGLLASLGMASLVAANPAVAMAISWAGFLYLLWLAWDSWRSMPSAAFDTMATEKYRRFFGRGVMTNLLNPKAILFYAVTLPALMSPEGSRLLIMSCVGISVAIATVVHVTVVMLAGHYQQWLLASRHEQAVRKVMALLLVGIACWFALSNRLLG